MLEYLLSLLTLFFFYDHRLAQPGEGIQECELVRWFVKEGDPIEEFQPVCEVQSDKATIEITSPYTGIIKTLRHPIGATVPVGDVLAEIQQPGGEATSDISESSSFSAGGASPGSSPGGDGTLSTTTAGINGDAGRKDLPSGHINISTSPAVRRLAQELNINLSAITGSGPGGRITKGDVLACAGGPQGHHPQQAAAAGAGGEVAEEEAPVVGGYSIDRYSPYTPTSGVSSRAAQAAGHAETGATKAPMIIPLRGYRKAMFKAMTAVADIPHFHYCDEVSTDALVELRAKLQGARILKGQKLTFLPFLIKAAALALKENPMINSSLSPSGDAVVQHASINIGVAVATPLGLVVPNIKNVDEQSIASIVGELKRLQTAAMANQLRPEDVAGGTFTISNIGAVGGTYATPLVNSPEVSLDFNFLGFI